MVGLIFYLDLIQAKTGRAFSSLNFKKLHENACPRRPRPSLFSMLTASAHRKTSSFQHWKREGARARGRDSLTSTSSFLPWKRTKNATIYVHYEFEKLCRWSGRGKKLNPPGGGVSLGSITLGVLSLFFLVREMLGEVQRKEDNL